MPSLQPLSQARVAVAILRRAVIVLTVYLASACTARTGSVSCGEKGTINNCSRCGDDCLALPNVAAATCDTTATSSECQIIACIPGWSNDDGDPSNGCESTCVATGSEMCNGRDDDCDGIRDNQDASGCTIFYRDDDGDIYGQTGDSQCLCAASAPYTAVVDGDCDDEPLACGAGCFPTNPAADVCDTYNQDCDTLIDEDPDIAWYHDQDGDAYTNNADTQLACSDPDGAATAWVGTATTNDCDDTDSTEFPEQVWYADCDNDTYERSIRVVACDLTAANTATPCVDTSAPDGGWTHILGTDCDDEDAAESPGGIEGLAVGATCSDMIDNDCDGRTDAVDPGCGSTNTPPLPRIIVRPGAGDTTTVFTADATGTTDLEDSPGALTYAWDWENNGTFDDAGVTTTHSYPATGDYTVALAVTDAAGLVAYATFLVIVSPAADLLTVTTDVDEDDLDATPAAPDPGNDLGTGFSLREATSYADSIPRKQTIFVPAGMEINLIATLLGGEDVMDGMDVVADGVVLDGAGLSSTCITVDFSFNRYFGLEVRNCPGIAVTITGTDNQFARCYIHDNDLGIALAGSGNTVGPQSEVAFNISKGIQFSGENTVEWSRIHDNGAEGIFMGGGADESRVVGNVIYANAMGIIVTVQSDFQVLVHNTIHNNVSNGVRFSNANADSADFRNNTLSNNGAWGVDGVDGNFLFRDNNDYFANVSGTCSGCSGLGSNSLTDDPLYIDAATADFRLLNTSTLINAGLDLGIDVNGPAPGNYNGPAPEIGAWEGP